MISFSSVFNILADKVSQIKSVGFLDDVQLSDGLVTGSIAGAAVIACSDMGWSLRYVCSEQDVNLHIFQNFGHRSDTGGFLETIVDLGVENVVVYGHSSCDYTRFRARAMAGQPANDPFFHRQSEEASQLYKLAAASDDPSIWHEVCRYNVLYELLCMSEHPSIKDAGGRGMLKLHGWFFNSESGHLEVFDPCESNFVEQQAVIDQSAVVRFLPGEGLVGER